MFSSVSDRACLDISVPGLGIELIDRFAASKNIPNAFSACSMVFSAKSRNSAGTSSFGSVMSLSSGLHPELPQLSNRVCAAIAPSSLEFVIDFWRCGVEAPLARGAMMRSPIFLPHARQYPPARCSPALLENGGPSGQRLVGRRQFVVGEAFDQLDHLEPLPRS